jgi:hypothetical protein
MPGFLYFIPREPAACKIEDLRRDGLGYAFEGRAAPALVLNGPEGKRGTIVADPRVADEAGFGYFPDRQSWQKIPPGSPGHDVGAWVGRASEPVILPQDLAREQQLKGHWVAMPDEQRWLVPIARRTIDTEEEMTWFNALPQVIGLGEDGQWNTGKVLPRFAPLWEVAVRWFDAVVGAESTDAETIIDFANTVDAAVLALSANYRIGKVEASMLGLLTFESAKEVLMALIDWPTITAWLNKKKLATAG